MNFKEVFLSLTEYTTPFRYESDLEDLLPNGVKKDKFGNYYIKIGESKTLFTCHLDNYCKEKVKINHIINGNIISTDKKSILGGDNKAGVTAIIYLIEQRVPGFYYFFCGEEPIISGGCWGSSQIVRTNPKFLKGFDRAVAFDRKKTGSIITRQMAQQCCSDEFADYLISEFSKNGVDMEKDTTGYYTDTGNFIELISECTNISIGVWNEHHENEYIDISYVEKVAKAASKIKWESSPKIRSTDPWATEDKQIQKSFNKFANTERDEKIFNKVKSSLEDNGFLLKTKSDFSSGRIMFFNHWFVECPIEVVINGGLIKINEFDINSNRIESQINRLIKKL